MSITATMVKELRERTGSGMMECKKALVAANGDLDVAIEQMRKSGLAKADKKSGRIAAEGCIGVKVSSDSKTAVIVDINCETDFVSKGDEFTDFVDQVATVILANDISNVEQLLELPLEEGVSIDQTRRQMVAKLGENITIRRFEKFTTEGGTGCYLHGSRIGVITELSIDNDELAKDVAMHIAASKPYCVDESQVPEEMIAKEKEIFLAQAADSGKPAEIIEKMIAGKVKKYLSEITLVGQAFIKDDKVTVGKLLSGKGAKILRFARYEVGEGIEKKEENFAEEVMAQVRGE